MFYCCLELVKQTKLKPKYKIIEGLNVYICLAEYFNIAQLLYNRCLVIYTHLEYRQQSILSSQ